MSQVGTGSQHSEFERKFVTTAAWPRGLPTTLFKRFVNQTWFRVGVRQNWPMPSTLPKGHLGEGPSATAGSRPLADRLALFEGSQADRQSEMAGWNMLTGASDCLQYVAHEIQGLFKGNMSQN